MNASDSIPEGQSAAPVSVSQPEEVTESIERVEALQQTTEELTQAWVAIDDAMKLIGWGNPGYAPLLEYCRAHDLTPANIAEYRTNGITR